MSSRNRKVVISYLMLSEDELDLRAERWISADTWELWRPEMAGRLSTPATRSILSTVILSKLVVPNLKASNEG